MISPGSFAAVLHNEFDQNKHVRESYVAKVLRKLRPIYRISNDQIGYLFNTDMEAPFDTIKQEIDNEEFSSLVIRDFKDIRLISLIRNPQETPPWRLFIENMRNSYNPGYSGVIFPVLHGGDFIIHNLGSPYDRSFDHAKIVMQSRDTDLNDLAIEPLENFIEERKRTDI